MMSLSDSSCHISDFSVASGSIAISTTDVDVKWNKLQAEVCVVSVYWKYTAVQ